MSLASLGNQIESSRCAIQADIKGGRCSLFVLDKTPPATYRTRRSGKQAAAPAGLGGMTPPALLDQYRAGGLPRLGRKLKPPARGQRDRPFRRGDDQRDGPRAPRLIGAPEQIGQRLGGMQALRHSFPKRPGHRPVAVMCKHHPDDQPGTPRGLEQRKSRPAPTFGFVDPDRQEPKRIVMHVKQPVRQGRPL